MPIPKGVNPAEICQNIKSMLGSLNYRGPVSFSAFGNMNPIPPSTKEALSSPGVVLKHELVDTYRELDHLDYELNFNRNLNQLPRSPMNIMLIVRFLHNYVAPIIIDYQSRGYDIILAHPPNNVGFSVKTRFVWSYLAKEEDFGWLVSQPTLKDMLQHRRIRDVAALFMF